MIPLNMLLERIPVKVVWVLVSLNAELTIGRTLVRLMKCSRWVKLLCEFTAPFRMWTLRKNMWASLVFGRLLAAVL